jgi:DNA-directed RNA polymerase subunit beta'
MLKIKPITINDLPKRSSKIVSVFKNNNEQYKIGKDFDVISKQPYDDISKSFMDREEKVNIDEFSTQTYIHLNISIVNVFLAGKELNVISRLIGEEIKAYDLSRGATILKINKNNENGFEILQPNNITNSDIYDSKIHRLGGDAIKFLLEKIDIEDKISKLLIRTCNSIVSYDTRKKLKDANIGFINYGSGDIWVIDNYYLNLYSEDLKSIVEKNMDRIREKLLLGDQLKGEFIPEIIAYLCFKEDKNRFINMCQNIIPVLPLGFRPTIDKMKDPLSVLYNRVVQTNNDLRNCTISKGSKLDTVRLKYQALYFRYLNLVVDKNKYDSTKFKPLLDILSGKEAVLRNNVQSATADNTGRSVITVDPYMSVDTIGIPEDMALNLCELDAIKVFKYNKKNKSEVFTSRRRHQLINIAKKILEGSYVVTGRQPTLYLLGVQAFKVKVVKGFSIVLNPIITKAFNADFDGDQMYVNKPQSEKAKYEASTLLNNMNNMFYPKDGTSQLSPRMEMIYGLYLCYNAKKDIGSREIKYNNEKEFKSNIIESLRNQDVHIDDVCIIDNKEIGTVGYSCLKLFLGGKKLQEFRLGIVPLTTDESKPEICVKEEFFKELFKHIKLNYSNNSLITAINRYVQLGFTVANLYAPDINILKDINMSDLYSKFEKDISIRQENHSLGFEHDETYNDFYAEECNKLSAAMLKRIKKELGENNGFIQLIESGARGNKSNLLQLFGMKGTILKNKNEKFNTVIKTPLSKQLSGIEHFITAYGSRQGIIDKTIRTYEPGYLSRKMSHVSRHMVIEDDDCGTDEGLNLNYDFLVKMYGVSRLYGNTITDYETIRNYTTKIMTGRFIVGRDTAPLTLKEADMIFVSAIAKLDENDNLVKFNGVKLRSPITCKSQCCVKCYGIDLTTNKLALVGTPVGYIAGPTIGEPLTQLIMKNFQKGGVVSSKNITSSFDTVTDLLEMARVSKINSTEEPIIHDFISPVEGTISLLSAGNGTSKLQILGEKGTNILKKTVYVYDSLKLKKYVKIGDSIQESEGILDVNEVLKYRGVEEAIMYILFTVYNIFENDEYIDFKHFETLVNGMILNVCTKGNDYFKVGNYYSLKEYNTNNKDNCKFIKVIRGLKQTPKIRKNFLTAIFLEDVVRTVTRNIITSGEDDLSDPFVRISLGLNSNVGSDYKGYIESRGIS